MAEEVKSDALTVASISAGALSNLPEPVQNGFFRAAGRLVGGALATPAAWLRRPAQAIEDKTDAQSLVTRRIAEAVAERAAEDPDILERAMESLVREEFRKQKNKEKITAATAEALQNHKTEDAPATDTDINEDWMNVFVRYSEDASTERMQQLWGRVLAGEIRSPGAFSLSTIRFLSELDSRTASFFEKLAPSLVGNDIFRNDERLKGEDFALLLELVSAGLLSTGDFLQRTMVLDEGGLAHVTGRHMALQIRGHPTHNLTFPIATLTRLGQEISSLVKTGDQEQVELEKIAKYIWENNGGKLNSIHLGVMRRLESRFQVTPVKQLHLKESSSTTPD